MGARRKRRSRTSDSWWTESTGGVVHWLLATIVAAVVVGGGLLTAFVANIPTAAEASNEQRPVPTFSFGTTQTDEGRPIVSVIGDSYTGGSDMNPGEEWPALLDIGVTWDLLAKGGTGYVATNPPIFGDSTFVTTASEIRTDADVVVFFGSRNDFDKGDPTEAIAEAFRVARERAPESTLIVVGPAWVNSDAPVTAYKYRDILRGVAEGIGATWVDPLEQAWFFESTDLIGVDGVHPTDAGMQYLADRFGAILTPALDQARVE